MTDKDLSAAITALSAQAAANAERVGSSEFCALLGRYTALRYAVTVLLARSVDAAPDPSADLKLIRGVFGELAASDHVRTGNADLDLRIAAEMREGLNEILQTLEKHVLRQSPEPPPATH